MLDGTWPVPSHIVENQNLVKDKDRTALGKIGRSSLIAGTVAANHLSIDPCSGCYASQLEDL